MILAVTAPFGFVACNDGAVSQRIGVSAEEGAVIVHFASCDPQRSARTVTLFAVRGRLVDDGDDVVMWQARTDAPNDVERFEVGRAPAGFEEEVALDGPVPRNESLTARVAMGEDLEALIDFELSELPEGRILSQRGLLDPEEFVEYAHATCPG